MYLDTYELDSASQGVDVALQLGNTVSSVDLVQQLLGFLKGKYIVSRPLTLPYTLKVIEARLLVQQAKAQRSVIHAARGGQDGQEPLPLPLVAPIMHWKLQGEYHVKIVHQQARLLLLRPLGERDGDWGHVRGL